MRRFFFRSFSAAPPPSPGAAQPLDHGFYNFRPGPSEKLERVKVSARSVSPQPRHCCTGGSRQSCLFLEQIRGGTRHRREVAVFWALAPGAAVRNCARTALFWPRASYFPSSSAFCSVMSLTHAKLLRVRVHLINPRAAPQHQLHYHQHLQT